MMTPEKVRQKVAKIYAERHDTEHAHAMEDKLYVEVLGAIKAGVKDADLLAAEALVTQTFITERWYA